MPSCVPRHRGTGRWATRPRGPVCFASGLRGGPVGPMAMRRVGEGCAWQQRAAGRGGSGPWPTSSCLSASYAEEGSGGSATALAADGACACPAPRAARARRPSPRGRCGGGSGRPACARAGRRGGRSGSPRRAPACVRQPGPCGGVPPVCVGVRVLVCVCACVRVCVCVRVRVWWCVGPHSVPGRVWRAARAPAAERRLRRARAAAGAR